MTTLGIIGAGHIGTALAQAALDAGHDVVISNSRGPETLTDLVSALQARPGRQGEVRADTSAGAASAADLAVVTIPLTAVPDVPVEPLAGKVVIDTNNYYPQRDGQIAELDDESTTTAELLQAHLPTSRVVKAFNHIGSADITADATPTGTPHRRALVVAGDDEAAKAQVSAFIDAIGFDVVDLGPLAEGWRIQRDTPGYGGKLDAEGLRAATAAAKRYRNM
ncbi:NAD(P)-binding domain-containing protein [Modestobacter sp. L9-4]|uniref:NADPH-dependent F420 reductase n=1 Tax=Modestobacter sp. L9-4 TaxID=2851567 RepID=UPI001C76025C|nr:NAD(P)-binding domain-containing protein [Modestobacter sp. L9-4]QXG75346.1 NAD(P)-binding domain-containing protein [Modestobacter sp. L9-4]